MPVTKSRTAFYDINLDQANTTGFLFGDDDNVIDGKLYTQASNEDNFPVLRREPNMVSQCLVTSTAPSAFLSALSPAPYRYRRLVSLSKSRLKALCCHLGWWMLGSQLHPSPLVPVPLTWEAAYFLPVWLTLA